MNKMIFQKKEEFLPILEKALEKQKEQYGHKVPAMRRELKAKIVNKCEALNASKSYELSYVYKFKLSPEIRDLLNECIKELGLDTVIPEDCEYLYIGKGKLLRSSAHCEKDKFGAGFLYYLPIFNIDDFSFIVENEDDGWIKGVESTWINFQKPVFNIKDDYEAHKVDNEQIMIDKKIKDVTPLDIFTNFVINADNQYMKEEYGWGEIISCKPGFSEINISISVGNKKYLKFTWKPPQKTGNDKKYYHLTMSLSNSKETVIPKEIYTLLDEIGTIDNKGDHYEILEKYPQESFNDLVNDVVFPAVKKLKEMNFIAH